MLSTQHNITPSHVSVCTINSLIQVTKPGVLECNINKTGIDCEELLPFLIINI